MMKRLGIVLLLILLLCGIAVAEPEIVMVDDQDVEWLYFAMESDATLYQYNDGTKLNPPSGLETMYQWMEAGADINAVAFLRMPSGRALISVQRTDIGTELSTEELCGIWPQLAKALAKDVLYVNDDPGCVSVATLGNADWMHIQTSVVLDGEKMLSVDLEGYSKCDDGVMVEIWFAAPAAATYLYDDLAGVELVSDRAAAQNLLESVRVPDGADVGASAESIRTEGNESAETEGLSAQSVAPSENLIQYRDPEGRFSITLPENVLVISPDELRGKMVTAQKDVKDSALLSLYQYWLKDAERYGATLCVEPNYKNAMLMIVDECDPKMTLEDVEAMEPYITANLLRELRNIAAIGQIERLQLAGREFVAFSYQGECYGREMSLSIAGSADGGTLREVNLWQPLSNEKDPWSDAMLEMLYSLTYEEVKP